jgi:hypothetical protein
MEIRNAKYNELGSIDCEIQHPDYGWIPFTASEDDAETHGKAIFETLKDSAAPYVPPPPPTEEELQSIADRERIAELKKLLADSDYKAMPDYDKTDSSILEQRQAWREEIRTLEGK